MNSLQVGPVENDEVVYRTIPYNTRVRKQIIDENLDTMDKVWNRGVLRHTNKRCLGTRRIIEEKKVPGPNDKTFTKLVLDPTFKWLNYNEVDQKSTYIGRLAKLIFFSLYLPHNTQKTFYTTNLIFLCLYR